MSNSQYHSIILKASACQKHDKIIELCKGKNILDIGCVGQDFSPDDPDWLHGKLVKEAGSVLGVDINQPKMDELNKSGFNIVHPDSLADNLKGTFDYVVMGDVIEHVDNPVDFLRFYKPYLKPGGKMIICTPNSFGYRYALGIWLYGRPGVNEEHTCWFDPFTMLETVRRAELKLSSFYWLKEYNRPRRFRDRILFPLYRIAIFFRKFLHPNFMFVVEASA
jgi:2-polyprenyl-3-methyl-5-hydroxy-6-metoxy-1,4-benzoquinol methylase